MRAKARFLSIHTENMSQATLSQDQKFILVANMRQFGGNFMYRLADAMVAADPVNFQRICDAFPEVVEKYLNWNAAANFHKN